MFSIDVFFYCGSRDHHKNGLTVQRTEIVVANSSLVVAMLTLSRV